MSGRPIPEKNLSNEEIRDLLRKASSDMLNIFDDRNAIIVWLCRAILKERENK
tara:strand:- start:430 stop:588 length:159 start_codon:yes stop_codon:yes gene_type:complete